MPKPLKGFPAHLLWRQRVLVQLWRRSCVWLGLSASELSTVSLVSGLVEGFWKFTAGLFPGVLTLFSLWLYTIIEASSPLSASPGFLPCFNSTLFDTDQISLCCSSLWPSCKAPYDVVLHLVSVSALMQRCRVLHGAWVVCCKASDKRSPPAMLSELLSMCNNSTGLLTKIFQFFDAPALTCLLWIHTLKSKLLGK